MTLPDERYRAIEATKDFLLDLLDPKKTPKVPSAVRDRAGRCLRHYPYSVSDLLSGLSKPVRTKTRGERK